MPFKLSRAAYAAMYGPTVGDKVRLADTDLFIEVEEDRTLYGEEVKFGGGKVIRDGMGQSQVTRAEGAVDTVITNALILDHWGIVKADIAIKDGRIAGIGKGGITLADVRPYMYPSDEEIQKTEVRGIYLSNFFYWDAKQHAELMKKDMEKWRKVIVSANIKLKN